MVNRLFGNLLRVTRRSAWEDQLGAEDARTRQEVIRHGMICQDDLSPLALAGDETLSLRI
jgi:hypothetical protein